MKSINHVHFITDCRFHILVRFYSALKIFPTPIEFEAGIKGRAAQDIMT